MNLFLSQSRYLRYFSFTILYIAQGFPFGLVTVALPAFLLERGATPAAVGGFVGGAMLPWTFKWLAGPMMDRFTFLAMGRRRPWVLIAQLGLALTGLGLVLRALNNYGLPHALRMTIGTEEANRLVVDGLRDFMAAK